MDREVLVPLLKAVVLADVMQVVTSDDNGPLHLHFGHHTFRQTMAFCVIPLSLVIKWHWIDLENCS